ncbi:MAG: endonuclease/exonuclease/phosphatase family protein [Planctomycetes bacterium]|nr:endonuclease/exonuclease/phosphatase family protein [Planctomycetota bacterium]
MLHRTGALGAALVLLAAAATAQWSPPSGQWGKVDPADVRVMTYNVQDALCRSQPKVEGANSWCAIARLVAALKPDVLLLQETGDNSGNGTGSGADSIAQLTTVIDYFLHGGNDAFNGNAPITSWVQKYAPGYDLPHVFVPNETDGFNRNVILSRYPFADLNGDGQATLADIPTVAANSAWAPGGDGGIRGFQFVEIDLPGVTYRGDLVVGGAHLKSGSAQSDRDQRVAAAKNVAYVVQYWFNGNGGSLPDPLNRIADAPAATSVLDAFTPVVLAGDMNEDELANGAIRGPVSWLESAQVVGGAADGPDRDFTDATADSALHFFSGSDASHSSGNKYDYILWQDSLATLRLQAIFISGSNPAAAQPPEVQGFAGGVSSVTSTASDHRPVFADLRLPVVDCNGNGVADTTDIALGNAPDLNGNQVPDTCECFAMNFCATAPNSVGAGAIMESAGSLSLSANNLVLLAHDAPPNASALYFYGPNETQVPFGNGWRCIGNPITRLGILQIDPLGTAYYPLDFQSGSLTQITPGTSWSFQLWYRNPAGGGAGFNLSNGRRFRFCP